MEQDVDKALVRVIKLGLEESSDAAEEETDGLLPALIEAGYVQTSGHSPTGSYWAYTDAGIARGNQLGAWDDE